MKQDIGDQMANGIFRAVFGGCMLFIIASALIWFFDLIPTQAKLDSRIGISSNLDLIHYISGSLSML